MSPRISARTLGENIFDPAQARHCGGKPEGGHCLERGMADILSACTGGKGAADM